MDLTDEPDDTEVVVRTDALTKTYAGRRAVDAVDLTVRRGEIYGFLGPNGAGKTTTLRMLLGLVRPTGGSARVLGGHPGTPEVTHRLGALIEGPGFYPYLSGRANLETLARYRGLPHSAVADALARVGLTDRAGDKFRSYSLGMKQRLGVAAALLGDPELIVLDEPTNGLDPAGMADMRALVVALARDGHTILLSSHLLAEVEEICDRVGIIAGGRLRAESTVAELRGTSRLRIVATPTERAVATAQRLAGPAAVDVDLGDPAAPAVRIDVPAERTPELVAALVADDVAIHDVRRTERTLAEVFFEMTGSAEPEPTDLLEAAR
jgi:ABC-2 type transport system ATP-binding protein